MWCLLTNVTIAFPKQQERYINIDSAVIKRVKVNGLKLVDLIVIFQTVSPKRRIENHSSSLPDSPTPIPVS